MSKRRFLQFIPRGNPYRKRIALIKHRLKLFLLRWEEFAANVTCRMAAKSSQIIPNLILDTARRFCWSNIMADEDTERKYLIICRYGITRKRRNTTQRPRFSHVIPSQQTRLASDVSRCHPRQQSEAMIETRASIQNCDRHGQAIL